MSTDVTDLPFGAKVAVTEPIRRPKTVQEKLRQAEAYANELGSVFHDVDGYSAELAKVRAGREIAEKLSPDKAREMAEKAVQFGRVVEALERVAAEKARRESAERARELFVDLRVRLEYAEKHYAQWRSAAAAFERDAAKGGPDFDRAAREADLATKKEEYEAWTEMAFRMVPGTGITLL